MTTFAERPTIAAPRQGVQKTSLGSQFVKTITSTDHKRIGYLYLATSFAWFLIGGVLALFIRAELTRPGMQFMSVEQYNQVFTMHGTIMLLMFATPLFVGFANVIMPLQIGAADVAFPRLNMLSYWLYFFGSIQATIGFLTPGGAASFGWTAYAPLANSTYSPGIGGDLWVMGLAISGLGTILGGVNFITTIFTMRAPGMTMFRMSIFSWNVLLTSILVLLAFPPLAAALLGLESDRLFGTHIFDPANGGAMLWQHLFWFFGHPEVYIMILPAFGIISEVIPTFSRKTLFGYSSMVYATASIAILSFIVWAHHMFATGMPVTGQLFFMYATMLIAVPTGVKIFNWVATMWKGSMTFETPMLWSIGFIFVFTMGGFTGLILAMAPIDIMVQDTYYVVAHFHYVLVAGSLFALFAGFYYWAPKWTGHMVNEFRGKVHFWGSMIFFNITFFPMHFLGLAGMPRRYADYPVQFADFNAIASIGSLGFGLMQVYFLLFVVLPTYRGGQKAADKPWDGAKGLEWTVPSPAPFHTFETPPTVK